MPRDLDCAAIHVLLLPMVHGQLTPALIARVQEHLAQCPACQQEFAELKALQLQVTTLMAHLPPAPDALWSRLQLSIKPESEPSSEPWALLTSCLGLLTALGVPQWATQPVTRSVNLAREVRDDLLASRIPDLSRLGLAGDD